MGFGRLRRSQRFVALLIISLMVTVMLTSSALSARPTPSSDEIIHPLLQTLMVQEPNRRVSIIVQKTKPGTSSESIARGAGGRVEDDFAFINSFTMTVPARAIQGLSRNPNVRYITIDSPMVPTMVNTRNLQTAYPIATGAAEVWSNDIGLTGHNVTVAIVDSGFGKHNDFPAARILATHAVNSSNAKDSVGHGTHVAGIIAGRSRRDRYVGIAPEANIVAVKSTNDKYTTSESAVVKALQWVYDTKETYNTRVVNLSITSAIPNPYIFSPVAAAVEKLWFSGIVVVVSAGNRGDAADAMWYPPANDPFVITVGALDDNGTATTADDSLAWFSARGITQNNFMKPEVVAPGRKIVAPISGGGVELAKLYPDRLLKDSGQDYMRLSGTSMAAPVVTGLVALMLEQYPELTPDEVKWALMTSAQSYPDQPAGTGGMANIVAALDLIEQTRAQGQPLGRANQNALPSPLVALLDDNSNWQGTDWSRADFGDTAYWDAAYWDAAYWDAAYWDAAYWDAAYWDAAYWDAAYWDAAYWDAAYWDAFALD